MKTVDNLMTLLTGPAALNDMTALMRAHDKSFREEEQKYLAAVGRLRRELPKDVKPSLDAFLAAWEADILARIQCAGYLGFRVNLENFRSPIGVDFVHKDTIDYLKEQIIGRFPENLAAQKVMEAFYAAVPQEPLVDDIDDYYTHLECACPKFAHYYGYVLANRFLPLVEPGYAVDNFQTSTYRMELNRYFGYGPEPVDFSMKIEG